MVCYSSSYGGKTDGIRCWLWWYLVNIEYFYPKPSDQPLHEVPDVWGTLKYHGLRFDRLRHTAIRRGSEIPFLHGRVVTPNASRQAIELYPRCSGKAHSKGPRTGPGNENMEHRCAFRMLRTTSMIPPLSCADSQFR